MADELIGIVIDEAAQLSLAEISRACAVEADYIVAMVEEGVIAPEGAEPHEWRFNGVHLRCVRVAVRLQHDLGVNLAGIALALQLMDEIESLRTKLR